MMKRFTMVILFMILISGVEVNAQPVIAENLRDGLSKDSYALQFQFADFLRFSSFQGGLLSFKRHLSERKALRYGISLNMNHEDNYDKYVTVPLDSIHDSRRLTTSNIILNLYYSQLYYLPTKRNVHFYFGLGVTFGFNHHYNVNTRDGSTYQSVNSWALGPMGSLGVEWFPHPDISISGEYSAIGTITYTHALITDYVSGIGQVNVRRNAMSYALNQQSVKLGISVYFRLHDSESGTK